MLQNRVDPYGQLIRTTARGDLMGNRGLLHNDKKEIVRPFRLKAWITCLLEFKGRQRDVMSPGLYTELFFLDEATAFAAGHRPCAECRRVDYNRFKQCWLAGNPDFGLSNRTPIREIDDILHSERMKADGSKLLWKEKLSLLPGGAFVLHAGDACLIRDHSLWRWSPFGYEEIEKPEMETLMEVLTPESVINTFHAGYRPLIRPGGQQHGAPGVR